MNFGSILRYGLNKAELPFDAAHFDQGRMDLNLIIQDLWYRTKADFRQSRGQIVTVADSDEYILNKHFDRFVKNSLQGPSSNPIHYEYLTPEEFFRRIRLQQTTSGDSFIYTFGEMVGYDMQLTTASRVLVKSSLASKTSGSVNVVAGSDQVKSSTDIFSHNDVGLRFKRGSDADKYKIGKFISTREIQLVEKYRGITGTGVSYAIGDVGVRCNVTGFVSGQIQSEDAELDGDANVLTQKTFNTIVSLSKTDKTGGNISFQNSDATRTLGTLAPGETEIERQTVLLWPKETSEQTLKYRFFMHHPYLWLDSDRLLLPKKWHRLVANIFERKMLEWAGKEIPQALLDEIARKETEFENEADDSGLMDSVPDGASDQHGDSFYYDKFREDF